MWRGMQGALGTHVAMERALIPLEIPIGMPPLPDVAASLALVGGSV